MRQSARAFSFSSSLTASLAHIISSGEILLPKSNEEGENGGISMPAGHFSGHNVLCRKSVSGARISRGPDAQSEAITGSPQAMASITALGKPSHNDGNMNSFACFRKIKGFF